MSEALVVAEVGESSGWVFREDNFRLVLLGFRVKASFHAVRALHETRPDYTQALP
jgi:hypothetical protein